jgi:hypothetical protein
LNTQPEKKEAPWPSKFHSGINTSFPVNLQPDVKTILNNPADPPWEVKLSGVPDYQTIYSRGCAPAASGCILGYYDHDYDLLIDGGDKNEPGHFNPDGYGYLHTIWDELGNAMFFIPGSGTYVTYIDNGIRDVCNSPRWGNNYNFTVTNGSWGSPEQQYSIIQSEIDNKRPIVYTLRYYLYGGGTGFHTVTLIGYGCLQPPWIGDPCTMNGGRDMHNSSLNKIADLYEYCYICHDNTTTTGVTVYLWWSEFLSDAHLITVHAGGAHPTVSTVLNKNLTCNNYPNPFNPSTEIHYQISRQSDVDIQIYNLLGQMIYTFAEGKKEPGFYSIRWNGCDQTNTPLSSGIYYYRILTGNEVVQGKMTLLR